jgi:hypothetical protein
LEVNASQKDKDFILAVNWKKAEQYLAQGKGKKKLLNMHIMCIATKYIRQHQPL